MKLQWCPSSNVHNYSFISSFLKFYFHWYSSNLFSQQLGGNYLSGTEPCSYQTMWKMLRHKMKNTLKLFFAGAMKPWGETITRQAKRSNCVWQLCQVIAFMLRSILEPWQGFSSKQANRSVVLQVGLKLCCWECDLYCLRWAMNDLR